MADLTLTKPAAGQQTVLTDLTEDNRLVLDFSPSDASMERAGDNLVFHFDDGSSLVLENFYTAYTGETLPDFEVDGAELSGADFFAALDSDLMPAAGPAAGPNAVRNAAYHDWSTANLMDGIDRLGGLDLGWNGEPEQDETLWGLPDDAGTNFAPVIAISGVVGVVEAGVFVGGNVAKAGVPAAGGQVLADDANGDALTYTFLGPNGPTNTITTQYGTITIEPGGIYTYTLNNEAANSLAEGQIQQENFTVQVSDGRGGTATTTVTVNVVGSNDMPSLELGKGQLTVTDDGANIGEGVIVDGGRALGDDPDAGHQLHYSLGTDKDGTPITSITDEYGTLTINPDTGEYTYTLDKDSQAVQKLSGNDDDVIQHVTVVVTDEYGAHAERPLNITIRGANDLPVITEVSDGGALDVKEAGVGPDGGDPNAPVDGIPSASGTITATDIDNDKLSYAVLDADGQPVGNAFTSAYGTLTVNSDGTYTYTLDNMKADSLNRGDTRHETFTVQVSDGRGGTATTTVTVTIEGTNDRPELTIGNAQQSLVEDAATSSVTGTFTVADVDADGAFGGRTGGTANQRYSIAGGTAASGDVTTGTGTPSPDAGGSATFTTDYGTLTVNPDGTWEYALDNGSDALHALREGETRTETFNVTVTDVHGATHTQPITVTITGTNDAPVVKTVTEHVKDEGVYGTDDVSPNTKTVNFSSPDTDGHIKDAEHRIEVKGQLEGFDAEGSSLTYGMDASGISAAGMLTLTNPGDPTDTTTIKVLSVSTNDGKTLIDTEAGTFTLDAAGHYSFVLHTNAGGFVDSMARGEKWNLTFEVTASDGQLTGYSSLTVCIEGTNEAPTFTQLAYKDYLGQGQTPIDASGAWVVEAAEQGRWRGNQGESNRVSDHSDVLTGSFGADDRDNGESANLKFDAKFEGGSTSGGNEDALKGLGKMELQGAPEDLTLTAPRPLAEHADKGTDHHTELAAGTYKVFHFEVGDFYLNVDTGAYYFDVNDDSALVNKMNLGDTHTLNFNVTVTDEHGASASHDFTVNISGRNDRPELTVEHGISTTEGQTATGDLNDLVDVDDADFGDSHQFFIVKDPTADGRNPNGNYAGSQEYWASNILDTYKPVTTLEGKYGTLTIQPDGSYEYKLYGPGEGHDDAYNAVKGLPEGATLTDEVFHIAVQDSHGAFDIQKLPITVTGVNDKPVVNGFNVDVKEDGVYTDGLGNVHKTDLMTDDNGNPDTSYQGWVGNADHKWAATGNVLTDNGWGGKPIVSDVDQDDKVTVDVRPNTDAGGTDIHFTLTNADEDTPHNLTPKVISNTLEDGIRTIVTNYGTLTLNTVTGEYNFTLSDGALNNGGIANMLAQGQKLTLSFILTATDENGQSAQHIMGVNIQGANDKPTLTIAPDDRLLEVTEQGVGSGKDYTNTDEGQATGNDFDYGAKLHYSFGTDVHGNPITSLPDQYGTMHIDPNTGRYWYELNNNSEDTQALVEGQKVDPTGGKGYTIRVTDEHGAYSEEHVRVEITGTNDAPSLVSGSGVTVTEAGVVPGGNTVYVPDPKNDKPYQGDPDNSNVNQNSVKDWEGDKLTYSLNAAASDTHNPGAWQGETGTDDQSWLTYKTDIGVFHLDPATGKYYFVLDNDAQTVQELNAGETIQRYIYFTVSDGKGGTLETWATANIKGTNDRPELTLNDAALAVTEDAVLSDASAKGSIHVDDADAGGAKGESFTFGLADKTMAEAMQPGADNKIPTPEMRNSVDGDYGTLSIDPKTGEYTYTLNNDSQAVQELRTGETRTETFHVVVRDSQGAFDIKDVTVTIHGKDDAIKLTSTDAQVVQITEDGVNFNTNHDNDAPQKAGGTFEVTPVDNPVDENGVNHLVYGFTGPDGTFHAGSVEVIQNGKLYGILSINAKGEYTFTLANNADVNALNAGELLKLTGYDLAVRDDRHPEDMVTSQKLDLYIHGSNDRPYFTVNGVESDKITVDGLVENGNQVISGQLTADDPDAGHNPGDLTFSIDLGGKLVQVMEGKYGVLELHKDGSYTYTITKPEKLEELNGEQSLINSALAKEEFPIRVTDPQNAFTSGTLVVDVTGSADKPVITGDMLNIQEDGGKPNTIPGEGELPPAIHNGQFSLGNLVDAEYKPGQEAGNVKWSVQGDKVSTLEDGSTVLQGKWGTLTVHADGSYNYVLDKNASDDIQQMNQGEFKDETFSIQAVITGADGKPLTVPQDVTIKIEGANDRPFFGEEITDFTGVVKQDVFDDNDTSERENPSVIFTGVVGGGQDTDANDATAGTFTYMLWNGKEAVTEIKTEYGTITINPESGEFTYILDNENGKLDAALKEADDGSIFDHATVVVVDPHGSVSADTRPIVIEIQSNPGSGDGGSGEGPSLIINVDKSDLNVTVREDNGEDRTPGDGETPPPATMTVSGHLEAQWSDGTDAADRVFGVMDANGNQVQSSAGTGSLTVDGKHGYIVINPATGDYTYTLYNSQDDVQHLAEGERFTEHFELMLNGKKVGEAITVTIEGTNDAPIIDSHLDLSLTERAEGHEGDAFAGLTASGTLRAHDIDHAEGTTSGTQTENLQYSLVGGTQQGDSSWTVQTTYGAVRLYQDENGEWQYSYTVREGTDLPEHLTVDDFREDAFTVLVSDGTATTEQTIKVTIDGINHAPQLNSETSPTLSVTEDEVTTKEGVLSALFTDDEGTGEDNLSFTVNGGTVAQGLFGTLQLVDGKYVYTLNNADAAVQGLDADNPGTDIFTITATDAHGVSTTVEVTVNVTGADDKPVLSVDRVLTVREGDVNDADGNISVSGQATAEDADNVDSVDKGTLTFGLKLPTDAEGKPLEGYTLNPDGSITNQYGTFTVDQNGKYTFTLDNDADAVRALTSGSLTEISVTLTVTDSQNNTTEQTVKVDITGTNTAPDLDIELEPTADNPVVENGADGKDSFFDTFTVSDVDGTVASVTATDGSYGTVELVQGENGQWTYKYTLDKRAEVLGDGEQQTDSFTITVTDAEGATTEKIVNVQIQGSNDAPGITSPAPTLNATEGGGTLTGQIAFTDVDAKDTPTVTVKADGLEGEAGSKAEGTYGTLTIGNDGKYTYTVTNHELGTGDKAEETFTVIVDDGHGGTATQTITVNLTGTNDAPVVKSSVSTETTGSLTVSDADRGDTHTLAIKIGGEEYKVLLDAEGKTGTCEIDGLGTFALTRGEESTEGSGATWTYAFTASKAATAAALLGVVVTQDFQLVVDDGHAQTAGDSLFVSYTGSNPNNDGELSLADWAHTDLSGTLHNAGDVSYAFTGGSTGGDIQGQFGTLRFDGETGTYHYELDTSESGLLKLAEARQDGPVKESFEYTYTSHDGSTQGGALDITLADAHAEVGTDGNDTLRGGNENDLLFGGDGDDLLFGGAGDDLLFGGAGNDYLDGGSGTNHLYGGAGHDILVYSPDNAVMDGGDGIDFLVGVDRGSLGTLLDGHSPLLNTEIIVLNGADGSSLTSLTDMAKLGIRADENSVSFGEGWTAQNDGAPLTDAGGTAYVEMHNDALDMDILVQQHLLNHGNS